MAGLAKCRMQSMAVAGVEVWRRGRCGVMQSAKCGCCGRYVRCDKCGGVEVWRCGACGMMQGA